MEANSFQASLIGKIIGGLTSFLPDWLGITVLALFVALVVGSWILKLVRKIRYRRAVRSGRPIPAGATRHGERPGSHYLGRYANQPVEDPGRNPGQDLSPAAGAQDQDPAVGSQEPGGGTRSTG